MQSGGPLLKIPLSFKAKYIFTISPNSPTNTIYTRGMKVSVHKKNELKPFSVVFIITNILERLQIIKCFPLGKGNQPYPHERQHCWE